MMRRGTQPPLRAAAPTAFCEMHEGGDCYPSCPHRMQLWRAADERPAGVLWWAMGAWFVFMALVVATIIVIASREPRAVPAAPTSTPTTYGPPGPHGGFTTMPYDGIGRPL